MNLVSFKDTRKLHLHFEPYHVSINSLNFSYECSALIFLGRLFQICGPRHVILLSPNLTVYLHGISRSFSLLFENFLLLKRFFVKEGLRSFIVLKVSKARVLILLISIVHLFDFCRSVL